MVLQIIYDCVLCSQPVVQPNTLVAGTVAGSLSVAISAFIKKVYKGETLPSSVAGLFIEELIKDYVADEKISETALYIESLIRNENDELLEGKISLVIFENSIEGTSKCQASEIARLILEFENNKAN